MFRVYYRFASEKRSVQHRALQTDSLTVSSIRYQLMKGMPTNKKTLRCTMYFAMDVHPPLTILRDDDRVPDRCALIAWRLPERLFEPIRAHVALSDKIVHCAVHDQIVI